jgi:hypothetical protein
VFARVCDDPCQGLRDGVVQVELDIESAVRKRARPMEPAAEGSAAKVGLRRTYRQLKLW